MQIGQNEVVKVMMGTHVLYEPSSWNKVNFTTEYSGAGSGTYAFVDGLLVFKSQFITLTSNSSQMISSSPTPFCKLPSEFTNYKVVATPSGSIAIGDGSRSYFGDVVASIDGSNQLYMDMLLHNSANGYNVAVNLSGLQISCERK